MIAYIADAHITNIGLFNQMVFIPPVFSCQKDQIIEKKDAPRLFDIPMKNINRIFSQQKSGCGRKAEFLNKKKINY
jgi:hypothetical protein